MVALPQDVVCRDSCDINNLSSYYVCHPHTSHHGDRKGPRLLHQGLWKVNDRWSKTLDTVQSTSEWLQDITL